MFGVIFLLCLTGFVRVDRGYKGYGLGFLIFMDWALGCLKTGLGIWTLVLMLCNRFLLLKFQGTKSELC